MPQWIPLTVLYTPNKYQVKVKIFITGATGFVGYYIAEKLIREGHSLTILYRSKGYGFTRIKELNGLVQFVQGDINNYELLEETVSGHEVIIHAAGAVSFNSIDENVIENTNVNGTTNLVNLALALHIPKFIYISSIAALGGHVDQTEFDESAEWDPKIQHHAYAISKHNAELEVWRGSIEGLDVCILSPSLVIGSWDKKHHSMQIFNRIKSGNLFYTTGCKGWVDARNIGEAVLAVLTKNVYNERIILNGHNESLKNVLALGAMEIGAKAPKYHLPFGLAMIGAKFLQLINLTTGLKNQITPDLVRSAYSHRQFDNTKSITLLDLKYIPLLDSIRFALNG